MSTATKLEYPAKLKEQARAVLESLTAAPPPLPLRLDASDVLRVGPTRVPLDTVIFAFNQGCTPEEILEDFPSLNLRDIYFVIAYYLQHQELINDYLEERRKFGEEVQRQNEARWPKDGLKEQLLARRAAAK